MNAKIGTSFGLALLLAIGVIATMLALGMLTPEKAVAGHEGIVIADGTQTNTPDEPGETATYTMSFRNHDALVANSGQIYIKFAENITVPSSIEKERITISTSSGGISNPVFDPEVTSDTNGNPVVIITIGDTDPSVAGNDNLGAYAEPVLPAAGQTTNPNNGHVLQFSRLAGLVNSTVPDTESSTWVQMSENGTVYGTRRTFTVLRWLELDNSEDVAGTVITITGKAFSDGGTANIWLDTDSDGIIDTGETVLGTSDANISSGQFTASLTVNADFIVGPNSLNAIDGTGVSPDVDGTSNTYDFVTQNARNVPQTFSKIGFISVSPTSASRGETVTITLTDFGGSAIADGDVSVVTFGGAGAFLGDVTAGTLDYDDSEGEFEVAVPSTTPLGTQTVTVTTVSDTGFTLEAARSTNITIVGGFSITVSPTTAVANQSITISGSGFMGSGTVAANTITIGGVATTHPAITIDDSGNLIVTLDVPAGGEDDANGVLRGAGDHEINVVDSAGRIGIVDITVPAKVLTLDSSSSRRSSTVGFSGNGFSADTTVTIDHAGTTVATVTADSAGNLPAGSTFTVPTTAHIPSENTVTATIGTPTMGDDRTATATHDVPGASITVDPSSASSGETVSVAGLDFPGFVSVTVLDIGGVSALPTPSPATGSDGSFSATVLVPALGTGIQTVLVTAGGTSSNLPITIVTAAAVPTVTTNATETTFADEITADNLVRVWWFSNADQAWSFFDPRPAFSTANSYTSATTGDIVWVNVTAETTFQGATLFPGWNLIALDG